jgi:long-chain fatty acid transport protein
MRRSQIFVLFSSLLLSTSALAGGFELRESSAHAQGTAYAGAAASDDDPSFLFYNPAAAGGVQTWDVSINGTGLLLGSSGNFTGTTAAGTPAGGVTNPTGFVSNDFIPSIAARLRLTDQLAVGLSVSTPWGEVTKYPFDWTGRYYAMTTRLTSINIQPVISYQVWPSLTFAAGPQIQYLNAELSEAIDFGTIGAGLGFPGAVPGGDDGFVQLHGNSWAAGYTLGAMWKPSRDFSFGVTYRSGIDQTLSGSENFTYDDARIAATINALTGAFSDSGGSTDLPTPASVFAGGRYNIDSRWTALAGLEWTNWSALHQLLVVPSNPANPQSLTVLDWNNSWFGSLGVEYRVDDQWKLRLGTAYDEAAAPSATVEPRIPDVNRYWISGGVGYAWSEVVDFDLAVSHLFTPHSTINQSVLQPGNDIRGSLFGQSSTDATIVSLQLVLKEPFMF